METFTFLFLLYLQTIYFLIGVFEFWNLISQEYCGIATIKSFGESILHSFAISSAPFCCSNNSRKGWLTKKYLSLSL